MPSLIPSMVHQRIIAFLHVSMFCLGLTSTLVAAAAGAGAAAEPNWPAYSFINAHDKECIITMRTLDLDSQEFVPVAEITVAPGAEGAFEAMRLAVDPAARGHGSPLALYTVSYKESGVFACDAIKDEASRAFILSSMGMLDVRCCYHVDYRDITVACAMALADATTYLVQLMHRGLFTRVSGGSFRVYMSEIYLKDETPALCFPAPSSPATFKLILIEDGRIVLEYVPRPGEPEEVTPTFEEEGRELDAWELKLHGHVTEW